MSALNARASEAYAEYRKQHHGGRPPVSRDAFEDGWETGYKAARAETAALPHLAPAEPLASRERLAEILKDHEFIARGGPGAEVFGCRCGAEFDEPGDDGYWVDPLNLHFGDVLIAAGVFREAATVGDGGLREALERNVRNKIAEWYGAEWDSRDDTFYETDDTGTLDTEDEGAMHAYRGMKWALAAHPAAPAVPQPAHLPNRWGETVEISEEDLRAAAEQADDWRDGLPAPIGSAVPQPVDREALADLLRYCQTKANGDNSYPEEIGRNDAYGDVADRLEAVLAGEQEQARG